MLVEFLLSDRELRIQGMRMKLWLLSIRCLPRPSAPRGFHSTIVSIPLDDELAPTPPARTHVGHVHPLTYRAFVQTAFVFK